MDKHFLVYRTTNLLNGRYYIGMHSTENVDDGYLGSGRRLKAEVKKYGRENFERIVIDDLASKEAMSNLEASLVTEEVLRDPLCLNLKIGGEGGWDHLNTPEGVDQRRKTFVHRNRAGQEAFLKRLDEDAKFRIQHLKMLEGARKQAQIVRTEKYPNGTFANKRHTTATCDRMRVSHQGKHDGEKNSQFGTCWMSKDLVAVKVKRHQVDEHLLNGYSRGRKTNGKSA